jgi:hypothetical protein
MEEIFAGIIVLVFTLGFFGLMAGLMYEGSDASRERARLKRKRNDLRIERERRELEMDLLLRERQQAWTVEDWERHRRRLEGKLDELHATEPDDTER